MSPPRCEPSLIPYQRFHATKTGTGKKSAKAGMRTVPSPNPENSVTPDTKTAVTQMIK
jgi:hypothetical protein